MKFIVDLKKSDNNKTIILFLTALILFGFLFSCFSYGINLDQNSEQKILYSNMKSYLKIFGQEDSELYSRLDNQGIICIEDNIDRFHGMAVFYPVFFVYYINQDTPYTGMLVWQTYIFLIYCLGLVSLFFLLKSLYTDISVAYFGTLLYFLTPRLFAEAHYNNKDMILISLVFCAMLCGWKVFEKTSWRWVVCFSVIGAFVSNIRVIGLFIWGGIGLFIIFMLVMNKKINANVILKILVSLALFVLLYICITPASRFGLFTFFRFLLDSAKDFWWNDYVLFRGELFNKTTTGIPLDYLPTMIILTTPVGVTVLFAIGLIAVVYHLIVKPSSLWGKNGYAFANCIICFVPLIYAVYNKTPVYNGWRHFYFSYAGIVLIASYSIDHIFKRFSAKKYIPYMVLGLYALFLFIGIVVNHPYEYCYYNVLAGKDIETLYELDYWDMSFKQAYEFVLDETKDEEFTVASISNPGMWGLENQYFSVRGRERGRIRFSEDWQSADYLIVNPTYAYMYGNTEYEFVKSEYELIKQIDSYGNVICEIYKK